MGENRDHRLVYLWAPIANLLWYLFTVVMALLSLALWPFDRTGELQHWCARWWCRLVAWTIFARIHVHGVEHVQRGRSYVYMANHASLIDTPALFAYLPYSSGSWRRRACSTCRSWAGICARPATSRSIMATRARSPSACGA
jgi:hypothetical protein